MYFPYNKRIYLPQFISSPFCFFPSKKKYYLIYAMFSHLWKVIFHHFFHVPFFCSASCNISFFSSYIYCLKIPIGITIFFQELMDSSKKEKKERGKQKTEKTRQCNLKKNFKKRKKKKIQKMCTPIQQKQTNEWNKKWMVAKYFCTGYKI